MPPTAYFIDVWSSIGPYDYWTADGRFFDRVLHARAPGASSSPGFAEFLGDDAPQISESGHDQLIGWLDGAQTNHLRVGRPSPGKRTWCVWDWRCGDAERTPWFDAAHHDRFVLHGAGYPGRYEGGLDPAPHGIYSDDYIATEVLTGHPAMVSEPFGRDVVRKYWLLHDLMRALALRRIERSSTTAATCTGSTSAGAAAARCGSIAERPTGPWPVRRCPQYGFFARVPTDQGTVEASIARRDGVIVEMARSAGQFYVNARGANVDFGPVVTTGGLPADCARARCWWSRRCRARARRRNRDSRSSGRSRLAIARRHASRPCGEDGKVLSRQEIRRDGDAVVIECAAGVFEYRETPVGSRKSRGGDPLGPTRAAPCAPATSTPSIPRS